MAAAPILILDFDETLVDTDSSEWVAQQLGAASLFDDLRWVQGMPWHQAMNIVLHTLHSQGVSIAHIRQAASSLPLPSETVSALKDAYALGCELRILSDANTFFIEVLLAHHGLDVLFTQIHSNPAWIDAMGCLHYEDYHGYVLPPHDCPLCPANMCKGSILEGIRAAAPEPATLQVIYAGDGVGDLCPSMRLNERDYVLPRQGYPLSKLLAQHQVKARVLPWTTLAATLHDTLLECVAKSSGFNPDSVSSSLILPAAGDTNFQKGSAVANASGLCMKSDSETKTAYFSRWRRAVVTSLSGSPSRSLHITSLHTRASSSVRRAIGLKMSQAGFCGTGHTFQNYCAPRIY